MLILKHLNFLNTIGIKMTKLNSIVETFNLVLVDEPQTSPVSTKLSLDKKLKAHLHILNENKKVWYLLFEPCYININEIVVKYLTETAIMYQKLIT